MKKVVVGVTAVVGAVAIGVLTRKLISDAKKCKREMEAAVESATETAEELAAAIKEVAAETDTVAEEVFKEVRSKRVRTELMKVLDERDIPRIQNLDDRAALIKELEEESKYEDIEVLNDQEDILMDLWCKADGSDYIYKIVTFDKIVSKELNIELEHERNDLVALFLNGDVHTIRNGRNEYSAGEDGQGRMVVSITSVEGVELYGEVLTMEQWNVVVAIVKDLLA